MTKRQTNKPERKIAFGMTKIVFPFGFGFQLSLIVLKPIS